MPKFFGQIMSKFDNQLRGNAAGRQFITVRDAFSNEIVDLYSNEDMTQAKSNPFKSNSNGRYEFYVPADIYTIEIGAPAFEILENVLIDPYHELRFNTYGLEIGDNLLTNRYVVNVSDVPGFIPRDGSMPTQSIFDYPKLAGTRGYPIIYKSANLNGIVLEDDGTYPSITFSSDIEDIETKVYDRREGDYSFTASNSTDGFLAGKSTQPGDQFKVSDGVSVVSSVATDGTNYIVTAGGAGDVSLWDYSTRSIISSTNIPAITDTSLVYFDKEIGEFVIAGCSGLTDVVVYTSPDGVSWTLVNTITFTDSVGTKYFAQTSEGFLYNGKGIDTVYFIDDMITATGQGTAILTDASASGFLFRGGQNLTTGDGLIIAEGSGNANNALSSNDGFLTSTAITLTGLPTSGNLSLLSMFGANFFVNNSSGAYYSTDGGLNWTSLTAAGTHYASNFCITDDSGNSYVVPSSSGFREFYVNQSSAADNFTVPDCPAPAPNNNELVYMVRAK